LFRTGKPSRLCVHRMWAHIAVCELVAVNLSLFAASVGLRPSIFAASAGSKPPLFASRSDLVCRPLQVGVLMAVVPLSRQPVGAPEVQRNPAPKGHDRGPFYAAAVPYDGRGVASITSLGVRSTITSV
jgi:hypothetical protein